MEKPNCCGIIGILFGHNYQSMIVSHNPQDNCDTKIVNVVKEMKTMHGGATWHEALELMGRTIDKVIDASISKQYKICCNRCGNELTLRREEKFKEN